MSCEMTTHVLSEGERKYDVSCEATMPVVVRSGRNFDVYVYACRWSDGSGKFDVASEVVVVKRTLMCLMK